MQLLSTQCHGASGCVHRSSAPGRIHFSLPLKRGISTLYPRSYYDQNQRHELAVQGTTQTQSESLDCPSTEQQRTDHDIVTTDNTAYATQAFKAAFEKAYRVQDSQSCLDLVKSLILALNKTQASKPDQSLSLCAELQSIADKTNVQKDEGHSGQPTPAMQKFSRESQEYLGKVLRGKHQGLMRLLLAAGNLHGALEYLVMLPPSLTLCSALMKECAEAGNLAHLQRVIQARQFSTDRHWDIREFIVLYVSYYVGCVSPGARRIGLWPGCLLLHGSDCISGKGWHSSGRA